jgi:hypothetical protein
MGMGLVITPLATPRRFDPLTQPLEASQNLGGRELVWRFDGGDITSDGGVLVLKKLEERTAIVRRFAACFTDYRKADQIEHPLLDLIMQRLFGLALGYEDLNDHDDLRRDPMLAVALGKDDVKGEQRRRAQDRGKALAGKSTLNRLELTAPDYGKRIPTNRRPRRSWWTRRASMRCWWTCSWMLTQWLLTRSFWIWMPPMISCTGIRKDASITATTTITATCRCTYFAENICCVRD